MRLVFVSESFLSFFLAFVFVFYVFGLSYSCSGPRATCFTGSMTAPRSQCLSSLTRRHGVKVASAISVEKCCLAVGEVVGHESILSASKMNNAIVIFLSTVEKANELVEAGIVVDELFTPVLPLSTPSKKVTLSNVPPFLSDEILAKTLSRYGKLVSPIKKIPIRSESSLLKHVVSFRRFVYMVMNDDADLDVSLHFRADEYDYIIYVTTDKMKCFNCGQSGHLIRACPAKNLNNPSAGGDVRTGRSDVVVDAAPDEAGPSDEAPGVSGLQVVEDKNDDDLPVITVTAAKDLAPENMFSGVEVSNAQAEVAVIETVDDLQSTAMNICDDTNGNRADRF